MKLLLHAFGTSAVLWCLIGLAVVLLTGCAHVPPPNCATAAKVRAASILIVQAIDRACPVPSSR